MYKIYEVGGKVRDDVMGIASNDTDYAIVMDTQMSASEAFVALNERVIADGAIVYYTNMDQWTIRCKFPKSHPEFPNLSADFRLSAHNGTTCDIYTDLGYRDFTINALARDVSTGDIIDHFYGLRDIGLRQLHCVVRDSDTFVCSPIRAIRALRLSMTHNLEIGDDVINGITDLSWRHFATVDSKKLQREVQKMFKHDTRSALIKFHELYQWNFPVWCYVFETLRLNPIIQQGQ